MPAHHAAIAALAMFAVSFAAPAYAVDNAKQLLSGGFKQYEGASAGGTAIHYTAPGSDMTLAKESGDTGEALRRAALRMPENGRLTKLRVHIETQTAPISGTASVTVFRNGNATTLQCTRSTTGYCHSNVAVGLKAGDRFAVEIKNDFINSGDVFVTFVMLLD